MFNVFGILRILPTVTAFTLPLQDISKRETRQGGQRESPDEDGDEVSEGEKGILFRHTCACIEREKVGGERARDTVELWQTLCSLYLPSLCLSCLLSAFLPTSMERASLHPRCSLCLKLDMW